MSKRTKVKYDTKFEHDGVEAVASVSSSPIQCTADMALRHARAMKAVLLEAMKNERLRARTFKAQLKGVVYDERPWLNSCNDLSVACARLAKIEKEILR